MMMIIINHPKKTTHYSPRSFYWRWLTHARPPGRTATHTLSCGALAELLLGHGRFQDFGHGSQLTSGVNDLLFSPRWEWRTSQPNQTDFRVHAHIPHQG